jgi:hypothetical protein
MSVAHLAEQARRYAQLLAPSDEPSEDRTVDANEAERLLSLQGYQILDTAEDEAFNRATKLATRLFGVPLAHIGIMDKDRMWYRALCGFVDTPEIAREDSICSIAFTPDRVADTSLVVVKDLGVKMEAEASNRPFKRAYKAGVRFYASAPLMSPEGKKLGTLCIADVKPREALSEEEEDSLRTLAQAVVDLMEARKLAAHFKDVCESKEWQIQFSKCGIGVPSDTLDEKSMASSESSRMRAWGAAREAEIDEARMREFRQELETPLHVRSDGG